MKKQIPVWVCPRCSYVMWPTTAQEIRDEEGLLAEFERAGQTMTEGERDPEPGESRSKGLVNLLLEKKRGEFPEGLTGYPIDKVGYHGFLTWDLQFDGVRIPRKNVIDQAKAAQEESEEEGDAAKQAGSKSLLLRIRSGQNARFVAVQIG